MKKEKKKQILTGILFYIFPAVVFLVMIWRCQMGFPLDEDHYIAEMKRLLQGDLYILEDWTYYQTAFTTMAPIYALWRCFMASDEGVILFFRYLFIAVQISAYYGAVLLIKRKYADYRSSFLILPLINLVFVPWQMNALSYYSVSPMLMEFILILMFQDRPRRRDMVALGILYSALILNVPYMLAAYPCLLLWVVVKMTAGKEKRKKILTYFGIFTLTCMLLGSVFLLPVLLFGGPKELIYALRQIIDDPDHVYELSDKLIGFLRLFRGVSRYFPTMPFYGILLLAAMLNKKFKKAPADALIRLGAFVLLIVDAYIVFFLVSDTIQYYFFGLFLYSLVLLALQKNYSEKQWLSLGVSVLYCFACYMGSNTGSRSIAFGISVFAGVMLSVPNEISGPFLEHEIRNNVIKWVPVLFSVLVLFAGRVGLVWYDGNLENITCIIKDGPCRGIRTSQEHYDAYYRLYGAMRELDQDGSILLLQSDMTMALLMTDGENCCWATSYFGTLNVKQQLRYMEFMKNKDPDYVIGYITNEDLIDALKISPGFEKAEFVIIPEAP